MKSIPSATNILHMHIYTINNLCFKRKYKKNSTGIMASNFYIAVLPEVVFSFIISDQPIDMLLISF